MSLRSGEVLAGLPKLTPIPDSFESEAEYYDAIGVVALEESRAAIASSIADLSRGGGPTATNTVPLTVRRVLEEGNQADPASGNASAATLKLVEFSVCTTTPAYEQLDKRLLRSGGIVLLTQASPTGRCRSRHALSKHVATKVDKSASPLGVGE